MMAGAVWLSPSRPLQSLPKFSPAVRGDYVPGTSAEHMYENQRKFNMGLGQLKEQSAERLQEILALKRRLAAEVSTTSMGETAATSSNHLIDSPMQSAIYTVQEMINELDAKGGAENQAVSSALGDVLVTLTRANPYMPAFDFTKTKAQLAKNTENWLVTTFAGERPVTQEEAEEQEAVRHPPALCRVVL
jgi:hypothetical protein|eukprot:SAG25_NODE_85_length_16527_cov_73.409240_20_plen_190_part_00